ncbi:hypothetical protein CC99x_002475 [Candidatus Berkiella cookevillensis]|uniref:Ribokinase n=1 Tax=Candidatus Berkiella cookevillensis TaxID=437022 RepID=A0A0Q9Y989_9GAMM|nr:PfkB family carbohydrate kinase [Candidatus Berkiella cookevillensis]MCS5707765.1 hypothetical protein [Candidatus Berkiella cookevillensis]
MRIYNLGSLNIEHVHQIESTTTNETQSCNDYHRTPGGKGYYQSIAIARAGAPVCHIGFIGPEGSFIKKSLASNGVDTTHIYKVDHNSGQEFVHVTPEGQLHKARYQGANASFEKNFIDSIFKGLDPKALLLIQNEINDIPTILEQAKAYHLDVSFHPSPFTPETLDYPFELVDTLIFNLETGKKLSHQEEPNAIIEALMKKYPNLALILTLGDKGVWYVDKTQKIKVPADPVHVIDENQAGNTFVGYYLAHKLKQHPIESCLKIASRASALCVTRKGKSATIPYLAEIK